MGRPPLPPFTEESAIQKVCGRRRMEQPRPIECRARLHGRQPLAQSSGIPARPRRDRGVPDPQMGARTRLSADQGTLDLRRQPYRRALRLRISHRPGGGCSTCASSLCGAVCGNGWWPAADVDGFVGVDRMAARIRRRAGDDGPKAPRRDQHDTRHRVNQLAVESRARATRREPVNAAFDPGCQRRDPVPPQRRSPRSPDRHRSPEPDYHQKELARSVGSRSAGPGGSSNKMRRAEIVGHPPPRDKDHQLASRKCRRESTPAPPLSVLQNLRSLPMTP